MLFFTVDKWKLVPTPDLLQVAELRAILDADPTTDKQHGIADLLYIYGMLQPKGPFSDFPVLVRDRKVRKHTYGEVDAGPYESNMPERWARIAQGMRAYLDHNENADQRLVNELNESVDWVSNSLKQMRSKPEATAQDIKAVIGALKEVNTLLVSKQQAEKLLEVGLDKAKSKSKGNQEASMLEKGLFRAVLGNQHDE